MFVLDEDDQATTDVIVPVADGCTITFSEVTPAMMLGARRAYRNALRLAGVEGASDAQIEASGDEAYAAYGMSLAMRGIKAWTGVGNLKGEPIPATAQALVRFIRKNPALFQKIDTDYVAPTLVLETEKNGSPASATGTSRGQAGSTAKAAPTGAKARRSASAAPRSKTSPRPTKATSPGKS